MNIFAKTVFFPLENLHHLKYTVHRANTYSNKGMAKGWAVKALFKNPEKKNDTERRRYQIQR